MQKEKKNKQIKAKISTKVLMCLTSNPLSWIKCQHPLNEINGCRVYMWKLLIK